MATYATPAQYLRRFGQAEAVQLLADEQRLLTAVLLADALAGTFTGNPTPAEQAAATDAAARLMRQLEVASNMMDGYLRSAVQLPLAESDTNAGTLEECCLALARFGLADDSDNATERLDKAAETWRRWLGDVAAGRVQLVGSSGEAAPGARRVRGGQTKGGMDFSGFGSIG